MGVFFEDNFFKHELFNAYQDEEAAKMLEKINLENRHAYLESQLEEKSLKSSTKL